MSDCLESQVVGPEFRINTYTSADQERASVAMDDLGRFVVVWQSEGQDGAYDGVVGRRFAADGAPLGGEFFIPVSTALFEEYPQVASTSSGDFVVVWEREASGYRGAYLRAFDADGAPVSDELELGFNDLNVRLMPTAAASGSGFVVVWNDLGDLFGRKVNSTGLPDGDVFEVETATSWPAINPVVAVEPSGGFLVVWDSWNRDGSSAGIFARKFDSLGVPQTGEFAVNSFTTNDQAFPDVAALSGGGFVVVWDSHEQDGSGRGIFARLLDSSGAPTGSEFLVNTYTLYSQVYPTVAVDGSGRFFVAWGSGFQNAFVERTYGQWYEESGVRFGGEFLVSSGSEARRWAAEVAIGAPGRAVAVWLGHDENPPDSDVYAQRLLIPIFFDGFESGDECSWSTSTGGSGCP
jgi:hypothetical protein